MTQEEKDLLLKDLCARLPYRVKCRQFKLDSQICTLTADLLDKVDNLEPYLRPMSSMTEKEMSELRQWGCLCMTPDDCVEDVGVYGAIHSIPVIDWLNTNHFDYRGMIEKCLALEAPEGMYKT